MAKKKRETVVIQGHRGGNKFDESDFFDLEIAGMSVTGIIVLIAVGVLLYWMNKQR